MIKQGLEILYKVFYNFYEKRDRSGVNPAFTAWIAISIFLGIMLFNLLLLGGIILNKDLIPTYSRSGSYLMSAFIFGATYVILFYLMNLRSIIERQENFFDTTEYTVKVTWVAYTFNILLVFALALFRKGYFDF